MTEEKKPKPRGLAAMTAERRKEIAAMGGRAAKERGGGLASVSPERRKEIAAMGGKAVQKNGTANKFTTESAIAALKKRHEK